MCGQTVWRPSASDAAKGASLAPRANLDVFFARA
jgi:hypothetical protein